MLKLREVQKLIKMPEEVVKFINDLKESDKYQLYYTCGSYNLTQSHICDVVKGIVKMDGEYYCTYIERCFISICKDKISK